MRYRCLVCSHLDHPAFGDPDSGIAPGARFEDISDDGSCPERGATKSDDEPMG
jgi:rubredoxin-NAD+ reductase